LDGVSSFVPGGFFGVGWSYGGMQRLAVACMKKWNKKAAILSAAFLL